MAKKRAATKTKALAAPVDAIKHKDARTNIPTRELAAFADNDERAPKLPKTRRLRSGLVRRRSATFAGGKYKKVPHVTLKSIANNPDIKEGMTREEIDAAIRKHADTETLYVQPYEEKGIVRVTGTFTVESLSPHRMLPAGDEAPAQGADAPRSEGDYLSVILDNIRKYGVQNTVKNERLHFDRLNAFPGEYIQGEGSTAKAVRPRGCAAASGRSSAWWGRSGSSWPLSKRSRAAGAISCWCAPRLFLRWR